MNRSVLGEDIMLCREGGREGGRGSKKVNEMENVAVMWSGWMAARRIGRKIGTLLPLSLMGLTECSPSWRGADDDITGSPHFTYDVTFHILS